MTSYKEQLPKITTFIFDMDGVLTNGKVYLINEDMVRSFSSRDAYAIQYAIKMGFKVFIITGGRSIQVKDRLLELGCHEVILSSSHKLESYEALKSNYAFSDDQVLYMGDDIPDYAVMNRVGLAACPQDAAMEIKAVSHYQSPFNGGENCVRDVIEQTLRVQNKWFTEEAHSW